jgi:probable rRNA maturation factor
MIRIKIANPYDFPLDCSDLKAAAIAVFEGENVASAHVILAFVDDAHIHRLNKQFLNHDEPTDVLTFPYSDPDTSKIEGEVVIGYEVAAGNALERGHPLAWELQLDVIHGCLHLCGYTDHTDEAARVMRQLERKYLAVRGLPNISGD